MNKNVRGIVTKVRHLSNGRTVGGIPFIRTLDDSMTEVARHLQSQIHAWLFVTSAQPDAARSDRGENE